MRKSTILDNEPRKYKINECLLNMPIITHRKALQRIPEILDISLNTFHNYRNILLNGPQDIPHEKVIMLEILFELKKGTLYNRTIEMKTFRGILKEEQSQKKFRRVH